MSLPDNPKSRPHYVELWVKTSLADQLRRIREEQGVSQMCLAAEARKSLNAVYKLEQANHATNPRLQTLLDIAAALGMGLAVKLIPYSEVDAFYDEVARRERNRT